MRNSAKQASNKFEVLESRNLLTVAAAFGDALPRFLQPQPDAIPVGDAAYFAAADTSGDVELWKSDGTADGTQQVKDIREGGSSIPHVLAATETRLFFSAYSEEYGRELWTTDGSTDGTQLVADLLPGPKGFFDGSFGETARRITPLGDKVYFVDGGQLWSSDGTEAGTNLIQDLSSPIDDLIAHNGNLYMRVDKDLWESDGSTAGTRRLTSFPIATLPFESSWFVGAGNSIYYASENLGLFRYDLTTGQMDRLSGILPKNIERLGDSLIVHNDSADSQQSTLDRVTEDEITEIASFDNQSLFNFDVAGSEVFFESIRRDNGDRVLWRTDGTPSGTLGPIAIPYQGTKSVANGQVYYSENRFDGGDVRVFNAETNRLETLDVASGVPVNFLPGDYGSRTLIWTANDGLWALDRAESEATSIAPNLRGPSRQSVSPATKVGDGFIFFSRSIELSNVDAWYFDGNEATKLSTGESQLAFQLQGFFTQPPPAFTALGDTVFALARDGLVGDRMLYQVDLTSNEITPVVTDQGIEFGHVEEVAVANDEFYFVITTDEGDQELWVTDGTGEGYRSLFSVDNDGNSRITEIVETSGVTYFVEQRLLGEGTTIWKTDGTVAGTEEVQSFSADNLRLYAADGQIFASTEIFGTGESALIRSNGSADGTETLLDNGFRLAGAYEQVFALGEELVFRRYVEEFGSELWISDGTASGTRLLKDINPGSQSTDYYFLGANADQIFFVVRDEPQNDGIETGLWVTDGTEAGTKFLFGGLANVNSSEVLLRDDRNFLESSDGIYFPGFTPEAGRELWFSDGTVAGTQRVAELLPGQIGSNPLVVAELDGTLYVSAADDGFGGSSIFQVTLNNDANNETELLGDLDSDSDVDFTDFLQFSAAFGKPVEETNKSADLDGNGSIGFEDFLILSANFGNTERRDSFFAN